MARPFTPPPLPLNGPAIKRRTFFCGFPKYKGFVIEPDIPQHFPQSAETGRISTSVKRDNINIRTTVRFIKPYLNPVNKCTGLR